MTALGPTVVMFDRSAVTFRTLAFAALIALLIAREALVQIGMPKLFRDPLRPDRGAERAVVAGLATAVLYFHRVTPYGAIANLAARPVVSVLVIADGVARA